MSLFLLASGAAQPLQTPGRLTDQQAAIVYGQCLATASAKLSHTSIEETKLFESARRSCIPLRIRVQTQSINIVSAGAVLDQVDAEFAARSVERTRQVRAMNHQTLQPGSRGPDSEVRPSPVSSDASAASVAGDAADLVTRICLAHAAGVISLQFSKLEDEIAGIRKLGLTYGVPPEAISGFDLAAQTMINSATLASKRSGSDHIILAVGGRISNCRVMVSGAQDPKLMAAMERTLVGERFGWKALPSQARSENGMEGRSYVRTAATGIPYLLHMLAMPDSSEGLRMVLLVSRAPPGAPVPQN